MKRQIIKNITEPCVFCGAPSSTREDVFPLWLQRRYNLFDQRLNLLDGSSIPYRQLKIQACEKCNNETLSRIESNVKEQKASVIEYYLWALKIYIGILYKESTLLSYNSTDNETIVDKKNIIVDLGIAKNIFNVYKNKGSFSPDPPGSVIITPRIGDNKYFDYCDIQQVPILGITLPNEFVFCLPFDKGRTMNLIDVNKFPKDMDDITFKFQIADMGYNEFRWEDGYSSLTVDNLLHIAPGSLSLRQQKPFDKEVFKNILKRLGLNGEYISGNRWKLSELYQS